MRRLANAVRTALPATLLAFLAQPLQAQERTLDGFEDVAAWEAAPSDGVSLAISTGEGRAARAMRLDFDFHGGAGYAVARRALPLDLPENYRFTFWIRADAPVNNLEFKLVDSSGDNVWWVNRRGFEFPGEWRKITIARRHLEFGWGPAGGGEMAKVGALELAITAGTGGEGTVWIDELVFEALPPLTPYDQVPELAASSSESGHPAASAHDGDPATAWRSGGDGPQALTVDFLERRLYGGLVIDWEPGRHAADYVVEISDDGAEWETVREVSGSTGGRDWLYLPETESRRVRLVLGDAAASEVDDRGPDGGYGIREIEVKPLAFSESPNAFFAAIAADAPRGLYPRYFAGEQTYWTVVGADGDEKEALLGEDGALEVEAGGFSVEPFLYEDGRLLTWADGEHSHSLAGGFLPIPTVVRRHEDLALVVTAFAAGEPGASTLYARYRVTNEGDESRQGRLFLALRPFQVNPPQQFLGVPGGMAGIEEIAYESGIVTLEGGVPGSEAAGARAVMALTAPDGFGALPFAAGDVTEALRGGATPWAHRVVDPFGYASGVLAYGFDLDPGESREFSLAIPFHPAAPVPSVGLEPAAAADLVSGLQDEVGKRWEATLHRVEILLPDSAAELAETAASNLAYILINRDGPAIQPGSRAYDRSWIRDGALTATALLRMGHEEEVREFIEWFAGYQFPSGKVPCCVDARGADPVPENDSHGEFIYLIAEYFRFTGDTALLREMWPHAQAAAVYIDSLRRERLTAEYRDEGKRAFYGLLPESISHEGYSAKPMHSYWDDFWALKGLADAVEMAEVLGEEDAAVRFGAIRDAFREDLYASLDRAMALHGIDYIPGSVELGDFDATSTTIALAPAGELANLPRAALERTFERYHDEFLSRRSGAAEWDAYTPYELRSVGAFIRLGWKDRAHELVEFFMAHRRPAGWNQWAEVVGRELRGPRFIGDMPHTWVGSDYIRSFLDFFAYEREADRALVIGAGIPAEWARSDAGVTVRDLRTTYGPLSYTLRADADEVRIAVGARAGTSADGFGLPPGGIVIRSPLDRPITGGTLDGVPIADFDACEATIRAAAGEVVLRHGASPRSADCPRP